MLTLKTPITSNSSKTTKTGKIENNQKIEPPQNQNNIKFLKTRDIEMVSNDMHFLPPVCFETLPSDTNSFASSVGINDKYLAVGDPDANRVVIYQRNPQGEWERNREIYPPENSTPYKIGNGFGTSLTLDRSALIVDAATSQPTKDVINPDDFTFTGSLNSVFFGKYFIQLDREQEVTAIKFPTEKREGFRRFYILSEGNPKLLTLPSNNEEIFGIATAVHNNKLLVGSPSRHMSGKGWLFDLKTLENQPLELTTENAHIGDTVAISEQFAVVGNSGTGRFVENRTIYPKTLIRSLKNGSTVVIDSKGYLSIDRNLLAVMLPLSRRLMQSPLLKIFRLDEDGTPHLILERKSPLEVRIEKKKYLKQAQIQNGWLITVERMTGRHGSVKLCLEESIEK